MPEIESANAKASQVERAEQEALESLCNLITANKVIPVIGFDLFDSAFEELKNNRDIDLLTVLAENYDRDLCDDLRKKLDIKTGFDLINALYYNLSSDKRDSFRTSISEKINDLRKGIDPVPQCFEQLARIKPFRFYINATIFNSLEFAVSTFKVPKAQNPNERNYGLVNYDSQGNNTENGEYKPPNFFYNKQNEFSTRNFSKPTICNLLGTHDKSDGYVLTDVHYMELLVKMLTTDESSIFPQLKFVLDGAALLFIGCDFPDWILRFFLRFCIGSTMLTKGSLEKSFLIEKNLVDEHSKAFLIGNYGIKKFKQKPDVFIEKLFKELESRDRRSNTKKNIEAPLSNNKVFISYNHDDAGLASRINEQLKENNIDTFFDEQGADGEDGEGLQSGDDLGKKIGKSIDEASHFFAIVTNNVNDAIVGDNGAVKGSTPKYYKREWNYAADHKNIKLIHPIVSSDYNGHTIPDNLLSDKAKDIFLRNSETYIERQTVSPPDYFLSQEFLRKIRLEQYRQRLSGK